MYLQLREDAVRVGTSIGDASLYDPHMELLDLLQTRPLGSVRFTEKLARRNGRIYRSSIEIVSVLINFAPEP